MPGGLTLEQAAGLVAAAGERFAIVSASFTAYDPDHDPDDRIVRAAQALLTAILATAET